MEDNVNNPSHYTVGDIECIDAIEAMMPAREFIGYCRGNAAKYIWRAPHKGSMSEDLEKAAWYLKRAADIALKEEERVSRKLKAPSYLAREVPAKNRSPYRPVDLKGKE